MCRTGAGIGYQETQPAGVAGPIDVLYGGQEAGIGIFFEPLARHGRRLDLVNFAEKCCLIGTVGQRGIGTREILQARCG